MSRVREAYREWLAAQDWAESGVPPQQAVFEAGWALALAAAEGDVDDLIADEEAEAAPEPEIRWALKQARKKIQKLASEGSDRRG